MVSFCCYGNLDLGEMYPIWNFHLSLAHEWALIFCWIDNDDALVAQSQTESLHNNLMEPPKRGSTAAET